MKASGTQGSIVNVTSAAGLRGGLGPAAYTASKAAAIALTQQAACECAPYGIRVNAVAPAYVSTVSRLQSNLIALCARPSTRTGCQVEQIPLDMRYMLQSAIDLTLR